MKSKEVSIIRGLAIIGVVLVHSPQYVPGIDPMVRDALRFGQMGCQAFFVLSCFCLCLSSSSNMKPLEFYKHRFKSIAPGYWMTLAISLAIFYLSQAVLGYSLLPKMDTKPLDILLNVLLLNGFAPYPGPMGSVVMGGWYIGTLVILYLLFPILKRVYFIDKPFWKKWRYILFPLCIAFVCSSVTIVTGLGQDSYCILGSVKYFSFINQLPVFALGFTLYDLSQREKQPEMCFIKFIVTLAVSVILIYSGLKTANILCPITTGMAAMYLYLLLSGKKDMMENEVSNFIAGLGDHSYGIYLSHFWIVVSVIILANNITGIFNGNPTAAYFIALPAILVLVYYLGSAYDKLIQNITKKIK